MIEETVHDDIYSLNFYNHYRIINMRLQEKQRFIVAEFIMDQRIYIYTDKNGKIIIPILKLKNKSEKYN